MQTTYYELVSSVQAILDTLPARAASPTFFHLPRPTSSRTRTRSNTNPGPIANNYKQIATTLYTINSKYRVSWECAELLIELGGGTPAPAPGSTSAPVSSSVSAPAMTQENSTDSRRSRERAITLAGDEQKPPHPVAGAHSPSADSQSLAWRASTGRHDLSQRQLVILREMLNNPDGTLQIPEDAVVNRAWRWGDAMSSTVTLPSEESTSIQGAHSSSTSMKKRRTSRMGMSGLREMLKALKRSHQEIPPPLPCSSASESSIGDGSNHHHYPHAQLSTQQQRRRAKTSTGPESVRSTKRTENQTPVPSKSTASPYSPSSLKHKASPRRPSLASIFRLGQKSKTSLAGPDSSVDSISVPSAIHSDKSSTTEEEDWDRMDSASDLEHAAQALSSSDGMSTVKGRKGRSPYMFDQQEPVPPLPGLRPVTPKSGPAASRSSIFGAGTGEPSPTHPRSTRLSNVEEHTDDHRGSKAIRKGKNRSSLPAPSPSTPRNRGGLKSDSVRSAPPQPFVGNDPHSISEFKLAMTPENIKPLLENAREVHTRLNECIAELKVLLATASSS